MIKDRFGGYFRQFETYFQESEQDVPFGEKAIKCLCMRRQCRDRSFPSPELRYFRDMDSKTIALSQPVKCYNYSSSVDGILVLVTVF